MRAVFTTMLVLDGDELTPTANLIDDIGMDSLDGVELVMAIEEEFAIEIPDEDAVDNIATFGDALNYMAKRLGVE